MQVFYSEGPLKLKFGDAGEFYINVPKEIPDHLARVLLRKGVVKEWVDAQPAQVIKQPEPDVTQKSRKREG